MYLILAGFLTFALVSPTASAKIWAGDSRGMGMAKQVSQTPSDGKARQGQKLVIRVVDENGVAVPSAHITLLQTETQTVIKGETDSVGRLSLHNIKAGAYELRVEREGFYTDNLKDLKAAEVGNLEITIYHQQEIAEVVNVISSPPAIDQSKVEASESLNTQEIVNVPYPTTRDIRRALPLMPQVVEDSVGQIHVAGSAAYQSSYQLDGFNITHPISGLMELRVSADAVRSIDVLTSRYSAEYGKGTGGLVSFATGMGDDRFRFSATNFIPSVQTRKGFNINDWTPRATFSGPLRRKKAWFFEAADAEYKLNVIDELPPGADRGSSWRVSNLLKSQVNLTETNILTASFLINHYQAQHAGLSRFNPLETTVNRTEANYLLSVKDQSYLSNGMLLEVGFGVNQFRTDVLPQGNLPYLIRPEGTSGNYFKTSNGLTRRLQAVASLVLPTFNWHGRHELKVGTDLDGITYNKFVERQPISILREDGSLSRQITFINSPRFGRNNFEASGFGQDRWSLSDRLLVEAGLRLDRDTVLRRTLVSPRLSSSYALRKGGNTKLAAGIGLFYDATNLDFITSPFAGQRFDLFYAPDRQTLVRPAVETAFAVNERALTAPRSLNWSVGLEQKLPAATYLRVEFINKRGSNGLAFVRRSEGSAEPATNLFDLLNVRRDHYRSIELTLRRTFKGGHALFASYTRSSARTNAAFDFNIDNPIFSQQSGGPLDWDTPNRLVSWGWLPLVKKFDLAYSLEWHDGYPFSVVNQDQQLVGSPNSRRLPTYFSLNTHVERRFWLLGFQWALRGGFENVTNRSNPTGVNNNIDSPQFLTFGGLHHRVFTGRIRFLGRK